MKTCNVLSDNAERCGRIVEGRTDYCATHNAMRRKAERNAISDAEKLARKLLTVKLKSSQPRTAPKKISEKRKAENPIYSERRKIFLNGKMCAVFPNLKATQIHHQAGRTGYVDQYAYDNKISAFLDERYWLAVSEEGHTKITLDSVWAIDMGFSIVRSIPIRPTI